LIHVVAYVTPGQLDNEFLTWVAIRLLDSLDQLDTIRYFDSRNTSL